MEWQVTSLETSKRLKELGVKQENEFYWIEHKLIKEADYQNCIILHDKKTWVNYFIDDRNWWNAYSAFTVAELGRLTLEKSNIVWKQFWNKKGVMLYSSNNDYGWQAPPDFPKFCCETEAEARGRMLVYLLENGLVKP